MLGSLKNFVISNNKIKTNNKIVKFIENLIKQHK